MIRAVPESKLGEGRAPRRLGHRGLNVADCALEKQPWAPGHAGPGEAPGSCESWEWSPLSLREEKRKGRQGHISISPNPHGTH